ncbi:MAG: hypothetical protein R3B89_33295 [Polyangiaceae bacterium]
MSPSRRTPRVRGLGALLPRFSCAPRRLLVLGSAIALISCASAPRPPVLGQADQVALGPKASEAKSEAPQAFAHAEKLRREADQAFEDGDQAAAEILAERSIAAYSHAFVLVRLSRAEERLAKVKADLATAQADLTKLDKQQAEVAREAEALELRLKVARDAVPLTPNEPASADREAARLEAARALAAQARLLCVSAWLIAPDTKDIKASIESADALAKSLEKGPRPTPIDDAIKLRSGCLKQLTVARRAATASARASSEQDELLKALSDRGDLEPHRDDRGVVVTLRGLYQGNKLAKDARLRLEALAKVAKANPRFPVLISVHEGGADTKASELAKTLSDLGAPRVDARGIGDRLPLVPGRLRGAAQRNTRVEIVFISPIN